MILQYCITSTHNNPNIVVSSFEPNNLGYLPTIMVYIGMWLTNIIITIPSGNPICHAPWKAWKRTEGWIVMSFFLGIILPDLKKMKVNLNESWNREGMKFKQMPETNIQCQFVVLFHHIHAVSLTIIACVPNGMDIHGHQCRDPSFSNDVPSFSHVMVNIWSSTKNHPPSWMNNPQNYQQIKT